MLSIYNNKELKGEDDGDESLNNSPPDALKCSLDLLTTKNQKRLHFKTKES